MAIRPSDRSLYARVKLVILCLDSVKPQNALTKISRPSWPPNPPYYCVVGSLPPPPRFPLPMASIWVPFPPTVTHQFIRVSLSNTDRFPTDSTRRKMFPISSSGQPQYHSHPRRHEGDSKNRTGKGKAKWQEKAPERSSATTTKNIIHQEPRNRP